jgi:hypothetical protein
LTPLIHFDFLWGKLRIAAFELVILWAEKIAHSTWSSKIHHAAHGCHSDQADYVPVADSPTVHS